MNCDVRQPIQDAFSPMTNVGKQYKLTLKPERGKTSTNYVNLFNGSHIVKVALDFQRENPNTLVIVTSDHDCSGMALEWPRGEFPAIGEIPARDIDLDRKERGMTLTTRELLAALEATLTADSMAAVNQLLYRQGVWTSGDHTAVDVPIMATGPGAERVSGRMDNTGVFKVMKEAMK
ncbi:MAG: hypothetical protein EYX74_03240 [Desulfobulbaceae bacterium]|nr:MAG: hypothetical protein EYX74_03240 [Desulfobulbaceae bacterium]